MKTIRELKLEWLHEALGVVTSELSRWPVTLHATYPWRPAINAFRCEKGIRICVDLAGVDRSQVDLRVEPQRVILRGTRDTPEPNDEDGRALQMLALEIDYGPFERVIELPAPINTASARAEQRNGFLWIELAFTQ